jgi:hypothetical protein
MTATKIDSPRRNVPLTSAPPAEEVKAPKKQPAPPATPPTPPADAYEGPKSTKFDPSKGIQNVDGRLSAKAPWDKLPSDLKSKIDEKVWMQLPEPQRATVVDTYQRLKRYGAWDDVTKVTGEKELREAPVTIGNRETHVAGNSGDIQYEIKDKAAFEKKLTANGAFGVDSGKAGALHGGQTSMREVNGGQTSLHVSTGPGNKMDAHIDQVNPTNQPERGQTQLDIKRGLKHWRDEVGPEMIRKKTGIPGVKVDGDVKPNPSGGRPEVRVIIGVEVHGIDKKKVKLDKGPATEGKGLPPEVMARVLKRAEAAGIKLPAAKNGNGPDVKTLAEGIALKINEAASKHDFNVKLDLGVYFDQKNVQPEVIADVEKLGKLVREEMAAARKDLPKDQQKQMQDPTDVTSITVVFGPRQGETVSLD